MRNVTPPINLSNGLKVYDLSKYFAKYWEVRRICVSLGGEIPMAKDKRLVRPRLAEETDKGRGDYAPRRVMHGFTFGLEKGRISALGKHEWLSPTILAL